MCVYLLRVCVKDAKGHLVVCDHLAVCVAHTV